MKCPRCNLFNPHEAERCDCGYDFRTGGVEGSYLPAQQRPNSAQNERAQKDMLYGALWCIGGIVVTALTYSAASEQGGTYVIAWGAILFGAIQFLRGAAARR